LKQLVNEVAANAAAFETAWPDQQATTTAALNSQSTLFAQSYERLVSFQAWRTELLEGGIGSAASVAFFIEAHNDAVLSHILSRQGIFRPALQSLRSCIENVMQSIYYAEHPVELVLWESGKFRMDRIELTKYLEDHPVLEGIPEEARGLSLLSKQYKTLNHAVHGSARGFRMTQDSGSLHFFSSDTVRVKQWATNLAEVVQGCNLLLLSLHRERLGGNALPNLRKSVSLAMTVAQRSQVKKHLKITLPA
jgi:hypothetical protein